MRKRGISKKKIDTSKAEDAEVIESIENVKSAENAENAESVESAEIVESVENNNLEKDSDDFSILTNPEAITNEFLFEKLPKPEDIPLNIPLAEETSNEGKTMKNLGFDVSELGYEETTNKAEKTNKKTNKKTISIDEAIEDYSSNNIIDGKNTKRENIDDFKKNIDDVPPPNFDDNNIDDVPPPNPDEKDIFDEDEEENGLNNISIPEEFVSWSAEKQSEWIVSIEKIIFEGFFQNRARINTIDVKQRLLKYGISNEVGKEIVNHINLYNNDVDSSIQLSKDSQKILKLSWVAVLKQYTNISEKLTPEATLIVNHLLIGGQMYFQANEIRKFGKELLKDIDSTLKAYSNKEKGNTN